MNVLFNLLGSLALCIAPVLLIRGSLKRDGEIGKIDPNPTMFFIRSVVAWINLATYFSGAEIAWMRGSILIVSSVSLTALFFVALILGRIRMVRWTDIGCLVFSIGVLGLWKFTENPVAANLLIQVAMTAAFIPSAIEGWQLRERQASLPYTCASAAYVFMTAAILTDPNGFKPFQLVNPLVPGIMGNGLLAAVAYRQEKLKR